VDTKNCLQYEKYPNLSVPNVTKQWGLCLIAAGRFNQNFLSYIFCVFVVLHHSLVHKQIDLPTLGNILLFKVRLCKAHM